MSEATEMFMGLLAAEGSRIPERAACNALKIQLLRSLSDAECNQIEHGRELDADRNAELARLCGIEVAECRSWLAAVHSFFSRVPAHPIKIKTIDYSKIRSELGFVLKLVYDGIDLSRMI